MRRPSLQRAVRAIRPRRLDPDRNPRAASVASREQTRTAFTWDGVASGNTGRGGRTWIFPEGAWLFAGELVEGETRGIDAGYIKAGEAKETPRIGGLI